MNIDKISNLIDATKLNDINNNIKLSSAIATDLVSDIMTFGSEGVILITGKIDKSVISMAEIMEIKCIILARGKRADKSLLDIATQKGISMLRTRFDIFTVCGILYQNGLKGGMYNSLLT